MVIARKDGDRIVVGSTVADTLIDMTERDLSLLENIPFWKVKGEKNCYVFAEDLTFATDLLRFNDYVFKNITDGNSVITNVVPKIKELLSKYSQIINVKLILYKQHLIQIEQTRNYNVTCQRSQEE